MIARTKCAALSGLTALLLCGPAAAQGLDYVPPGAGYAAFKNQVEDKKPIINSLYNQTHIRSTVKRALREASDGASQITSGDDLEDDSVVNGVFISPTARIDGDLNIFIDIDGDTLVLTE